MLDLTENIDFSYQDIDEVKDNKYDKKFLELLYSYDSNLDSNKIEYWNMHTFTNKIIEKQKIILVKNGQEDSAYSILSYFIRNNLEFVQENCKYLYNYYLYNKSE